MVQTVHNIDQDPLIIGHKKFLSRLMLGTGKYQSFREAKESILVSGCEILTVAVRRAQSSNVEGINNLLNGLDWSKIWLMPNTAGAQTAEEAVRLAFMGREILKNLNYTNNNFIKLEVIPDPKHLLPDSLGTLTGSEYLVNNGFDILPYINADPVLAKQLESIGCVTVMPLGSPIGSGQGLKNLYNIEIIVENSKVPVIVDAGIGSPSQAARKTSISFYCYYWARRNEIALILNVIDPRIGGVMIMGDRGTGKSTTIRAVADLLPAIKVVADDPFNSSVTDFELMSESVKMRLRTRRS